MNLHLRKWLKTVTPEQARAIADSAGTSVPHLRHVAAGRRNLSANLAQRLAHATNKGRTLPLMQQELCIACSRCPLV